MNDLQMKSQEKEDKNEVIVASDKHEPEEAKESTDATDDLALDQSKATTNGDVINISDEAAQDELLVIPDAEPLLAEVSVLSSLFLQSSIFFLFRTMRLICSNCQTLAQKSKIQH